MALKEWADFYPDILPSVPGCPLPMIDHYLRNAVIEMCVQSKRLKYEMPAFDTVAGTYEYVLSPGAGMGTITILDGTINGVPLDPLRRDELTRITDWQSDQGSPSRYLMIDDTETVRLWKTPDATYSIALTLAIKPSRTAVGVEEWFAERFKDGIVAGAIALLAALPKKPWTDASLFGVQDGKFKNSINRASAETARDATRAPLRTTSYGRF